MRADKRKWLDLVAKEVVKNPLASQQDIANATGLSVGSVNAKLKEVEWLIKKDDRIVNLTNKDLEIVTKAQQLIADKFEDEEQVKKMKVTDISSVAKDSSARYSIFKWDVTDKDGGFKNIDVTGRPMLELDEIRRQILSKKE